MTDHKDLKVIKVIKVIKVLKDLKDLKDPKAPKDLINPTPKIQFLKNNFAVKIKISNFDRYYLNCVN